MQTGGKWKWGGRNPPFAPMLAPTWTGQWSQQSMICSPKSARLVRFASSCRTLHRRSPRMYAQMLTAPRCCIFFLKNEAVVSVHFFPYGLQQRYPNDLHKIHIWSKLWVMALFIVRLFHCKATLVSIPMMPCNLGAMGGKNDPSTNWGQLISSSRDLGVGPRNGRAMEAIGSPSQASSTKRATQCRTILNSFPCLFRSPWHSLVCDRFVS